MPKKKRSASHAGSWYSNNGELLMMIFIIRVSLMPNDVACLAWRCGEWTSRAVVNISSGQILGEVVLAAVV